MPELGVQIQNTIRNTMFVVLAVCETHYRFGQVNHNLTTQLSIIVTVLLTPNFACNV